MNEIVNQKLTSQMNRQTHIFLKYFIKLTILISFTSYAKQPELVFSVPSFAPFSHFEENKKCKGASELIIDELSHQIHSKARMYKLPYGRILQSLHTGDIDLALIFKNITVAKSVEYIGPISLSKVIILTNKNNTIATYDELKNLGTIAVIRNAEFHQKFDHDPQINKVYVNSYKQAVQMFTHNRVDAVIGSQIGLEYALRQEGINNSNDSHVFVLGVKEWWIHLSKQSPYFTRISEIKKAVKKVYHKDLTYQMYHQQIITCLH